MAQYIADPVFNPELSRQITASTKLGPGVSVSTFLGSYGNRASIDYIPDQETRHLIARYLYLHAEVIRQFNELPEFQEYRLIVAESISPDAQEELASGQAVVYQLVSRTGELAHDKIFDVAVFWKDYIKFDKLFLDYDTYNPDGTLTSSIVLFVPEIGDESIPAEDDSMPDTSSYQLTDGKKICLTYFNGKLMKKGPVGLVEILPKV